MNDLFSCTGRKALVTGGSRGLGFEIARALALAGGAVVINGRNEAALDHAMERIRSEGGCAIAVSGDLVQSAASVVTTAADKLDGLDCIIHAAAVRDRRPLSDLSGIDFRNLVDANLSCAYDLAQAALPCLERSSAGRLIFISSIAGNLAHPGDPAYAVAKGGLNALTRALAVECGTDRMTVNCVAPGLFLTETNQALEGEREMEAFIDMRIPLKRWGRPDEIVSAVLFLASPASGYVNGITLPVDGGLSSRM